MSRLRSWLTSDAVPIHIRQVCLSAVFIAISEFCNIPVTIICGSDFAGRVIGSLMCLIVGLTLISGVYFCIKTNNANVMRAILYIVGFVLIPLTYISSGALHSGSIIWALFGGIACTILMLSDFEFLYVSHMLY